MGLFPALYSQCKLYADRIGRLEELPNWTWNTITELWEDRVGRLLRYTEREGHTRVPKELVEDGDRLGGWVYGQRAACSKGKLDADGIHRLEEVPGWTWTAQASRSVSISRAMSDVATHSEALDGARKNACRLISPGKQPK